MVASEFDDCGQMPRWPTFDNGNPEMVQVARCQALISAPRLDANTHKPSNPHATPPTSSSLYIVQMPTSMHLARTPFPTVRASLGFTFCL